MFLDVGHTHMTIDRLFGQCQARLSKTNMFETKNIVDCIQMEYPLNKKSFSLGKCEHIVNAVDFKYYFHDIEGIKNITKYKMFRFENYEIYATNTIYSNVACRNNEVQIEVEKKFLSRLNNWNFHTSWIA